MTSIEQKRIDIRSLILKHMSSSELRHSDGWSIEEEEYDEWINGKSTFSELKYDEASYHLQDIWCLPSHAWRILIFAYLLDAVSGGDYDNGILGDDRHADIVSREEFREAFDEEDIDILAQAVEFMVEVTTPSDWQDQLIEFRQNLTNYRFE